jgi:hypothetical protein
MVDKENNRPLSGLIYRNSKLQMPTTNEVPAIKLNLETSIFLFIRYDFQVFGHA